MAVCEAEVSAEPDKLVVAVQALDRAFQRWVDSDEDSDFPPALVSAIGVVCALCTTTFPSNDNLMQLFMGCLGLARAFQDVLNQEPGSARRCVAEIENVVRILDVAETEEAAPQQTVASMLKDYGTAPLRYQWIANAYGDYDSEEDIWRGPFFSRSGRVLSELIEKEASNPGSVLGDDFKPLGHQRKQARIKAAAIKQLGQLQAGLFRPEGGAKPERATVLEMLQEGQYPDVIAAVKRVPIESVLDTAKKNGIKVADREAELHKAALDNFSNPMAEAAGWVKPQFDDGDDDDAGSGSRSDTEDGEEEEETGHNPVVDEKLQSAVEETVAEADEDSSGSTGPAKMTSEELTDFTLGYLAENPGAVAHEILAAAVTETGKAASRQMLAPILKSLKGTI